MPSSVTEFYLGIQENLRLKWIGAPEGVVRAWSIKLRPESEKWNVDEFNGFVGLPWHVRPSSSRDGMKILLGIEKDLVVEIQDNVDQPKSMFLGGSTFGKMWSWPCMAIRMGATDVWRPNRVFRGSSTVQHAENGSPRRWSRLKRAVRGWREPRPVRQPISWHIMSESNARRLQQAKGQQRKVNRRKPEESC